MNGQGYRVASAIAEGVGHTIVENASLAGRNTFRVAAKADMLIDVRKPEALAEVFGYALVQRSPLLVLGQGSNILLTRDWPGIVLSMASHGMRVLEDDGATALVRVEAGEAWNDFVTWSLAQGWCGLENLALIPGTVGAAPIQNIGAYGTEVGEFIETVESWDRQQARLVRIPRAQCAFAYRDSVFKREPERHVVTAVEFRLPRQRALNLDYPGIADELAAMGVSEPRAPQVAEAVARLRTRKLPNPALVGNAGSFFKNPIVASESATVLLQRHPNAPNWPLADGRHKLSAAWLIETCGLKGLRRGEAGVSERHALVLVNLGQASGAEIRDLAEHVRSTVHERFGVWLEPEPIII